MCRLSKSIVAVLSGDFELDTLLSRFDLEPIVSTATDGRSRANLNRKRRPVEDEGNERCWCLWCLPVPGKGM